jgi:hypothetical protein
MQTVLLLKENGTGESQYYSTLTYVYVMLYAVFVELCVARHLVVSYFVTTVLEELSQVWYICSCLTAACS